MPWASTGLGRSNLEDLSSRLRLFVVCAARVRSNRGGGLETDDDDVQSRSSRRAESVNESTSCLPLLTD